MPTGLDVLRKEIHRLARNEARAIVLPLKKRFADLSRIGRAYRSAVADVETILSQLEGGRRSPAAKSRRSKADAGRGARIRASSVRSIRKHLKVTQDEFAKLAGVTGNAVWLWENGKSRPTEKSKAAITRLQGLSPEEASQMLAAMPKDKKPAPSKRRKGKRSRAPASKKS